MDTRSAGFLKKWEQIFGLPKFDPETVRAKLALSPFEKDEDFGLIEFLFVRLPGLIEQNTDSHFEQIAQVYGLFCRAVWQGKAPFVARPQTYALQLQKALLGEIEVDSPKIAAIVSLCGRNIENGLCGFNTFSIKEPQIVQEADSVVYSGAYEQYLTELGRTKYKEFEESLLHSEEFKQDWELIKKLYPKRIEENKGRIIHRRLLNERSWDRAGGVRFDTPEDEFTAVYELFCWKYYLWGMKDDTPYLQKPSVNITPLGTQIFIPAYMSYDTKRDFDHKKIGRLHKARGVRRQGYAFSESRAEKKKLSALALQAKQKGKEQGLKGDKLYQFIAEEIGQPWLDDRTIRKLCEKKK